MSTPPAGSTQAPWPALGVEVLLGVGAMAAGIVALGVGSLAFDAIFDRAFDEVPYVQLAAAPLSMAIAALFYRGLAKSADPAEPQPIRAEAMAVGWALLLTLALGVALLVGSSALSWLFERLGLVVVEQGRVLEMTAPVDGKINPAVYALAPAAILAAPLAEEWFFRGWFFRRVFLKVGPRWAYVASAIFFAAIHMNLRGAPIYMLQACIFGYAFARTGRLWAAIGVHAINNALTMAILVWMPAAPIP